MDLDCMKYAELRGLAKDAGLKANMKADKLREALKRHYQEQQHQGEQGTDLNRGLAPNDDDTNDNQVDQHVPTTSLFVTKRRGKASKRKNSEDVNTESEALETDEKDSHSGAQTTSAKKRRVFSTQQPDMQPEKTDTNTVPATCDKVGEPKVTKAGKIPRHEALLKRIKPMLKPTTPNFKKLHEAHFNKMESIDLYVQRKTKQMDVFRNSVKELKLLSDKTISKPAERNTKRSSRTSLFSPASVETKPSSGRRRHTQLNKPDLKDSVPFKPSILSTRRINVRFSQVVQDNEQKRAVVKTPARLSPCVDLLTPGQDSKVTGKPEIKTSGLSSTKTPGSTFVFNGNTSISNTPGTNKKSTFDLKASLSRPLSYKPHKGKLKPFEPTQETLVGIPSNQKNYKQHKVQTREERRTKHKEDRKQKKENMLGARRGLTMS
ncbi:nucleolar and spindle-associated protein 1 isoform X3 [Hypomesus transpacificus]|uniref:nucleolar and spindle-associated protein 1 isoform X3 n=1 Tax=Hypomesus transpacificus TaxID=137520 RepID=UPI001F081CA8|nr:nucleolar and spindle-associated protein 1 isoform X3 [Hypomesus transpacificus]